MNERRKRLVLYNPAMLDNQEIAEAFSVRTELLDELVSSLSEESPVEPRHHLLWGKRGMGKSTLLRRVRYAVEELDSLRSAWFPIALHEEHWGNDSLAEEFREWIDTLLEAEGKKPPARYPFELSESRNNVSRARAAFDFLKEEAGRLGKGLLVLIENLDAVFDLLDSEETSLFEDLLENEKSLRLIATTTACPSGQKEFEAHFRLHELNPLSDTECRKLLLNLCDRFGKHEVREALERDHARLKPLVVLSGGTPRTMAFCFNALALSVDPDPWLDLEGMVDLATPEYKLVMDSVPRQATRILHVVARNWSPMTAAEITEELQGRDVDINVVSSQLAKLTRDGFIEKVGDWPELETKTAFQISERFYNIWYLIRRVSGKTKQIQYLGEFLRFAYGPELLAAIARRQIRLPDELRDETWAGLTMVLADAVPGLRGLLGIELWRYEVQHKIANLVPKEVLKEVPPSRLTSIEKMEEMGRLVMKAPIGFTGWDPGSFTEALARSVSLSQREKAEIAGALGELDERQVRGLTAIFEEEGEKFQRIFGPRLAQAVFQAIRTGYMEDLKDRRGAADFAAKCDLPELAVLPLIVSFEKNPGLASEIVEKVNPASRNPFVLGKLAEAFLVLRRWDDAERVIDSALQGEFASSGDLRKIKARILQARGKQEEAVAVIREAIHSAPPDASLWNSLGRLLIELDRFGEAEIAYRNAIGIDPSEDCWVGLGRALSLGGKLEEAEQTLRGALERYPEGGHLWNSLGCLLHDLKRHDEAAEAFEAVVAIAPDASDWRNLALERWNQKNWEAAERACRRGLETDPRDAWLWVQLGLVLIEQGRFDEASHSFQTALAIEPTAARWRSLAGALREQGRLDEAGDALRQAIALDPDSPYLWESLAQLLAQQRNLEEALRAWKNALALGPKVASLHNNYAWFLYENGLSPETAESEARLRLELDARGANAWHTLAVILVWRGQWTEAAALIKRFIENSFELGRIEADWADIVGFFREAVKQGRARESSSLISELDFGPASPRGTATTERSTLAERWRPLYEALNAIAVGTYLPLRRAPQEVRDPAKHLVEVLLPKGQTLASRPPSPERKSRRRPRPLL